LTSRTRNHKVNVAGKIGGFTQKIELKNLNKEIATPKTTRHR